MSANQRSSSRLLALEYFAREPLIPRRGPMIRSAVTEIILLTQSMFDTLIWLPFIWLTMRMVFLSQNQQLEVTQNQLNVIFRRKKIYKNKQINWFDFMHAIFGRLLCDWQRYELAQPALGHNRGSPIDYNSIEEPSGRFCRAFTDRVHSFLIWFNYHLTKEPPATCQMQIYLKEVFEHD